MKRLTTETGAGQWGSALAFAGALFNLEVTVYMVKVSYEQKPYRRAMMETWGATVHASPSYLTNAGRGILAGDPDSPGSLGIAISEAVEDAATHDDAKYSLGSVVNHVLLHQTVIGLEAKKQMEMAGDYPDVVIACVGGGSNFAGLTYPFIGDKLKGVQPRTRFIAAEPAACPTLTRGVYKQKECFAEAVRFARTEGFLPAPESAHALRAVAEEAAAAREAGEPRTILFGLSGHGHFDMSAYDAYFAGNLEDIELSQSRIDAAIEELPRVPAMT